jgi:hypothetical protein
MSQIIERWSVETTKVFNGILLFVLSGIVYNILSPIESLLGIAGGGVADTLSIICYLLLVGIIAGYVLTLLGLSSFATILEDADGEAIRKVRLAFILVLIGTGLEFVSLLGFVCTVLYIIAYIIMLLGYSALKKSPTFPATKAASTLFTAMILLLIGAILDFIPLIGDFLEGVLNIIAYIMMFLGWSKIKNLNVSEIVNR